MVTPTPRAALVAGKVFAAGVRATSQVVVVFALSARTTTTWLAGVRATSQVVVVLALSAILGVRFDWNPLHLAAAVAVVVVAAAFFSALSMTIAGLVLTRERLMGIGQAITMPLFFGSNALYPSSLMPTWIRWLTRINPLSYEVGALRTLLLGTPGNLVVDALALVGAAALGITVASALLGRLAR